MALNASHQLRQVCDSMDVLRTAFGFVKRVYGHVFIRPFQRYNVEERASKLLDRMEKEGKPIVKTPLHKPTKAYLEQLIREHPEIMEKVNATPKEQLDNLSKMKVKVDVVPYTENVKIESEESRHEARRLPQDRVPPLLSEMGVKDPAKVPIGKMSLREAIDMIKGHALDPETFNVEYLAEFHDMEKDHVFYILDRFKTFEVYNRDDMAQSKDAPWYSKENLEYFFLNEVPVYQLGKAMEEREKRKAWEEFLEKKKKQRYDPILIEIAGLKPIAPPGQKKLDDPPADKLPEPSAESLQKQKKET